MLLFWDILYPWEALTTGKVQHRVPDRVLYTYYGCIHMSVIHGNVADNDLCIIQPCKPRAAPDITMHDAAAVCIVVYNTCNSRCVIMYMLTHITRTCISVIPHRNITPCRILIIIACSLFV